MLSNQVIADHYTHGSLLNAIENGIGKLGKTTNSVSIEDLGPVDEFHIGGRQATDHFLSQLDFSGKNHILDIGCGLGGAARYVAGKYNVSVTGIDLTEEYIDAGNMLSSWVNLDNQINLKHGSALSMSFDSNTFDGAYMLHVGMNIADKVKLFMEIYRVLMPGSFLGIYDIMQNKEGNLSYPVPWASEAGTSMLAPVDQYKDGLKRAGFEISSENNRSNFALEFFKQMKLKTEANGGPPALGLHTLMQDSTPLKLKNMVDGIAAGIIAPVEIIAFKK